MAKKQKLELTWIGKENRPKLEPRILIEDPEKSYHSSTKVSENDIFDNLLIHGDNLLALKALEQDYAGKVKCVFIDPPYNTGQMFEHYDDGVEHSLWLNQLRDRVRLLRELLTEDGIMWIVLDDNEAHYFKVLCDEEFGRSNFLGNAVWEKSDSPRMDAVFFSYRHDHLLCYAKNKAVASFNKFMEIPDHYNRIDEQGRKYYTKPLRAMGGQGDSREARPTLYYPLIAPDGSEVYPKRQDGTDGAWRWKQEKVNQDIERIEWVDGRNGWTPYYRIYADNIKGRPIETILFHSDVGSNRTSKAEIKTLFPNLVPFGTPKPEGLIQKIMHVSTKKNDLVLDSFLGSGTTAAVAHKMGRRWIGIELGDHCETHCLPRLKKVIDGVDSGGITEAVKWEGGGGFRYYELGPSLIQHDKWGNPVINKEFDAGMLAQAMCKLEGFTYSPSDEFYWQQGFSSETDYIYITTQTMTADMLAKISDEVGNNGSLLVCCASFRCKADAYPNITLKKIPKAVLRKCEWGKDDYSLEIKNLPEAPVPAMEEKIESAKPKRKFGKEKDANQQTLF